MLHQTADDILESTRRVLSAFYNEGRENFPDSTLSHVGFRCTQPTEYAQLVKQGTKIGDFFEKSKGDQAVAFIRLHEPLSVGNDARLNWLEILSPRSDYTASGPQLLVFFKKGLADAVKIPSKDDPNFILRCQGIDIPGILKITS